MPELPEVETVKAGLEKAALGRLVESVTVNRRDLRFPLADGFEGRVGGALVQSLTRRGKYALMHLSGGAVIVLHLGMSGRIRIFAPGQAYEPRKHDHVIFTLDDGALLVFEDPRRFGYILLGDERSWRQQPPFAAMGPEPLGNEFSGQALFEKFQTRRTPVKTALLDQRIVAGLGNIYVCEALYKSGIHPARLVCDISARECETLAREIRIVLGKAIKAGGSTLRDYQKVDGSLGYFQYSFSVYDRAGEACGQCGGEIQRMVQSARSSFYCEHCQR